MSRRLPPMWHQRREPCIRHRPGSSSPPQEPGSHSRSHRAILECHGLFASVNDSLTPAACQEVVDSHCASANLSETEPRPDTNLQRHEWLQAHPHETRSGPRFSDTGTGPRSGALPGASRIVERCQGPESEDTERSGVPQRALDRMSATTRTPAARRAAQQRAAVGVHTHRRSPPKAAPLSNGDTARVKVNTDSSNPPHPTVPHAFWRCTPAWTVEPVTGPQRPAGRG